MHEKIKKDLEEKDKKLSQVEQAKHRLGRWIWDGGVNNEWFVPNG
jgi:hypothetical protein